MVERLAVIAPFFVPLALMLVAFGVYAFRTATGRAPDVSGVGRRKYTELFGPYLMRYIFWLLRPAERLVVRLRVSPNGVTMAALLVCAGSGLAAATGHLSTAAWLYVSSGALDILDGRLARATNRSSPAGAFLDSVADRWAELFVFAGFCWLLQGSWALMATIGALAGSLMVSYTRARAEGLGIQSNGGTMQRAERIFLVSLGTLIAACVHAQPDTRQYMPTVIGVAMAVVGLLSSATAIGRLISAYRELEARAAETLRRR